MSSIEAGAECFGMLRRALEGFWNDLECHFPQEMGSSRKPLTLLLLQVEKNDVETVRRELADLAQYVDWIDDWLASDFIVGSVVLASNTTHLTTHSITKRSKTCVKTACYDED